jgi:hypothetical protein
VIGGGKLTVGAKLGDSALVCRVFERVQSQLLMIFELLKVFGGVCVGV